MTLFGAIKSICLGMFAFSALVTTGGTAIAEELPRPVEAYTGTATVRASEMEMVTTIWAEGRFKRVEGEVGGVSQLILVRPDHERIYVLDPASNSGIAMPYSAETAGLEEAMCGWEAVREGSEVIDGQETVRYAVAGKDAMGQPLTGTLWFDANGILIRARTASELDGRPVEGTYDLTDVSVGNIDPKLFDIPKHFAIQTLGN